MSDIIIVDQTGDEISLQVLSDETTIIQVSEPSAIEVTVEASNSSQITVEQSDSISVEVLDETNVSITIATQGERGPSGSVEESFETVSKNIKAWPATFNWVDGSLSSIVYSDGVSSITKSFSYSGGYLTQITLSGDTPLSASLIKSIVYSSGKPATISYS